MKLFFSLSSVLIASNSLLQYLVYNIGSLLLSECHWFQWFQKRCYFCLQRYSPWLKIIESLLCSLIQRMSSQSWEAEAVGNQVFLWRILGAVNSEGEGNMYSSSQPNWEGLHGDESGCGNQLHRTEAAEDWERSWLSGQKSHFHSHQKSHFHSHWCYTGYSLGGERACFLPFAPS